jgi:adenylate cyclase
MSPDEARALRHEIRTPVNHLIGYSELLLEEEGLEPHATKALQEVRGLARRVLELIPDMLSEDGTIAESVDALNSLLDELEASTASLASSPGRLPPADIERIVAAAARLRELGLRLSTGSVAVERGTSAAQAPKEGRLETILVVDDDEANRDVLGRRLQRLGYGVVEARDGVEALDRLADGNIDLVLLDVMMPRLDGYAVLERQHKDAALRDIPVIMISALDQLDSIVRCIELGAEDYLPKPFDPVLLQARVGACLEKRRAHNREKELLATVTSQSEELRALNSDLEQRVEAQVREVERLSLMERFVPPQLAEVLAAGGAELLKSHRREITVLFCDLRGFTPFSETAEPEDVMSVLRELHNAVGPLIFEYGGTLAQFTGDGMMVFFNDPIPCDEPAWQAVQLALAMQERASELSVAWRRRGHRLEMGVGIAVGYATCGQIGFEGRFEYTAIGTVTNLASRLCSEAKGGQVLASQRVVTGLEGRAASEHVGDLVLKGFVQPVPAYSLERKA